MIWLCFSLLIFCSAYLVSTYDVSLRWFHSRRLPPFIGLLFCLFIPITEIFSIRLSEALENRTSFIYSCALDHALASRPPHLLPTFVNSCTRNQIESRSHKIPLLWPLDRCFIPHYFSERFKERGTTLNRHFYVVQVCDASTCKWRSILKFSLREPDMILAHNKKTRYA